MMVIGMSLLEDREVLIDSERLLSIVVIRLLYSREPHLLRTDFMGFR
jgi:hypothetical protein